MIRRVTFRIERTGDIALCQRLRRVVFIDEQGVSEEDEVDGLDPEAVHLLAFDGERPVGTARMLIKGETGKIGRVCVLSEARGTGLGAALIRACLEELRRVPGVSTALLGAQTHALGFYERLGFVVEGEEYLDAGIPHYDMRRPL
ncbi:MAG: GNAT family N-acetyltransferase [Verrucomicrobiales bacterium]|nr:GNAT family N-acetyltransferase [Verrucomicrobiales bacterium]